MACSSGKCVKWILFIFNFLFFISGCGLIGLGVVLNVAYDDWEGISDYHYISIANVAIAAGIIIVMIAFLGCCGAITENKIMLLVFFVFLLVIFLLEIGSGVAAYMWRNEIENELLQELDKRIPERYYTEKGVQVAMNAIQKHFKCCGLHGVNDWNQTINGNSNIDQSCCIENTDHVEYDPNCKTQPWKEIEQQKSILGQYYSKGCYSSVKDFFKENLWCMALIGFAFAGLQIIGMVCTMMLYCVLRRTTYSQASTLN